MPDQITVTSTTGPAIAVTARNFSNVKEMRFDVARQVLTIFYESDTMGPKVVEVSLSAITTVTYTIATRVATVTVS